MSALPVNGFLENDMNGIIIAHICNVGWFATDHRLGTTTLRKLQYMQKDKWLKLWHLTPQREGNSLSSYRSTGGFVIKIIFFFSIIHRSFATVYTMLLPTLDYTFPSI